MVVFDLDGTLINSLTDLAISVNYGLKLNRLEEKPVEIINICRKRQRNAHQKGNG